MSTYAPPVDGLLQLGEPKFGSQWANYPEFGPDHVPELIRLLQDEPLYRTCDGPENYAQVHAWRVLGQLRAEAAVGPLLDLLAAQQDDEGWDDWITEGVPVALGMIGPPALEPTAVRLEETFASEYVPGYFAAALSEIAKRYPETRDEVVRRLTGYFARKPANHPTTNGWVLSNLLDLNAVEAWPAIEAAFAAGEVDETICGSVEYVKAELGLGPKPARPYRNPYMDLFRTPDTFPSAYSARTRAEKRAKLKKAAKRKKKRSR